MGNPGKTLKPRASARKPPVRVQEAREFGFLLFGGVGSVVAGLFAVVVFLLASWWLLLVVWVFFVCGLLLVFCLVWLFLCSSSGVLIVGASVFFVVCFLVFCGCLPVLVFVVCWFFFCGVYCLGVLVLLVFLFLGVVGFVLVVSAVFVCLVNESSAGADADLFVYK